jgi:CheY-like chemotaxis protein
MSNAGKRVLIVDDLAEQRDIYATLLRLHGYDVLEAEDGERAVQMAFEARPHAIVMDVVLPVLDGWTATRQILADPRTMGTPVIVLTAREVDADRERSEEAGACAYIVKPCDPNLILTEVQRVTGVR